MDGNAVAVGDQAALKRHEAALARTHGPIKPMRKLFGGESPIDRRLVRRIVEIYARKVGLDYESAHRRLTAGAERQGFESPDATPDRLLTPRLRVVRAEMRKRVGEARMMRPKFVGVGEEEDFLDGKGETPDMDDHQMERSMRGRE